MSIPEPESGVPVLTQAFNDAELHKALLDQLEEGLYMVDLNRRILYWNAGAERISGYLAHEVTGHFCHGNLMMHCDVDGEVLCGKRCPLSAVMADGKPRECTVFLRHKHGHRVPVRVQARAIYDANGTLIGAVEFFEEAAAPGRRRMHALEAYGCLDELTGVPARPYGEMKAWHELEALNSFGIPLGWLRVELDEEERLERCYGHGMVDAAAKMIAATLDANVGSLDVLTRWGRAEFRIAVHCCSRMELAELAHKLAVLVRSSNLEWWGDPLRVNVSIAAVMAEPGDSLDSLEARAAEAFASCQACASQDFCGCK